MVAIRGYVYSDFSVFPSLKLYILWQVQVGTFEIRGVVAHSHSNKHMDQIHDEALAGLGLGLVPCPG